MNTRYIVSDPDRNPLLQFEVEAAGPVTAVWAIRDGERSLLMQTTTQGYDIEDLAKELNMWLRLQDKEAWPDGAEIHIWEELT